jgi:hypothetical protein
MGLHVRRIGRFELVVDVGIQQTPGFKTHHDDSPVCARS